MKLLTMLLTLTSIASYAQSIRSEKLFYLLQELKKTDIITSVYGPNNEFKSVRKLKYVKCNSDKSISNCLYNGAYQMYPGYKKYSTCSYFSDIFVDKDVLIYRKINSREDHMFPSDRFPKEALKRLLDYKITSRAKKLIKNNESLIYSNYTVDMREDLEDYYTLSCLYGEAKYKGLIVWDKEYGEGIILTLTSSSSKAMRSLN